MDTCNSPEHWLDLYGDYLYRYVIARISDRDKAQDLVQDTFLAAIKNRNTFTSQSSEKTWITGILKHKILDYYRWKARNARVTCFETQDEFDSVSFTSRDTWASAPHKWGAPDKLVHNREFLQALKECLARLPDMQKQAFILRELSGEESESICKTLDITPTNLNVIMYRARGTLRVCLEKNYSSQGPC